MDTRWLGLGLGVGLLVIGSHGHRWVKIVGFVVCGLWGAVAISPGGILNARGT
jgi:hypothetical protein